MIKVAIDQQVKGVVYFFDEVKQGSSFRPACEGKVKRASNNNLEANHF